VDNVGIDVRVDDGTAEVVGTRNIVVNRVTLGLGVLHGVRSRTLFGKVNDRIGLLLLNQLDEKIVLLRHVQVHKLNLLS